ncbi:MAG: aminotransferase class I/II-fold pyridoxal phosphate-dependent enzyme [Myxococcota bacterium]|nr:aminotransferase class I/II-fold pyridoxal phosphate-dependent enzyme [Myxococcota bacterium]MDW8363995.1 aminotransferase class I/II-fold pyridoxal phosphate-dependent enzyme [Myxococcales bacterium]
MSWIHDKAHRELERVERARALQVYPYFRPFESGGLRTSIAGRPIVNFSSNDYLGLTTHPRVKEAARAAVDRFACGLSSSRVQATTTAHVELEERLARWLGYEACLLFTTGYQAMVGTIMALADRDTTLVLDNLSHACILDGTFLAAGTPQRAPEVRFFNHNSARSLDRVLRTRERPNALVLFEGIYSLDGDEAPIVELVEVCERHGAVALCDDAHGTGTLGPTGRGIVEKYGLQGRVPLLVSTFSKSLGGIGGMLLADRVVVDHVKHQARSFLFSASLPVPIVAAAAEILTMLETDGATLVRELHDNAAYMRRGLLEAGFDLGKSNTHIMPVMCRDERKALFMHLALLENGVLMVPITYPGVKQGEERLRLNVTRGHTREEMDRALELLRTYGEAFYVLSGEDLGPMEEEARGADHAG